MTGDVTLIPEIKAQAERVTPDVRHALIGTPQPPIIASNNEAEAEDKIVPYKRRKLECTNLDFKIAEIEAKTKEMEAKTKGYIEKARDIEKTSAFDMAKAQVDTYKVLQEYCGIDVSKDKVF